MFHLTSNRQSLTLGAMFIITSELMFASMGAVIHGISNELNNEMIVFFRNLFGLLALLPFLLHKGFIGLKTEQPWLMLFRALAGLGAMYCFFYAIAHIQLAEAMVLKLSAPLFIPFIAWLWLGERLSPWVKLALLVGFTGVFIMLTPDFSSINEIALIAVAGGFFAALAKTSVRKLTQTDPTTRIVFYFATISAIVSAIPLIWAWQNPSNIGWLGLLAVGVFATLGQLLLTQGFSLFKVSHLGLFSYSSVIFGSFYGWYFWNEILTLTSLIGALLIVLAGIMASHKKSVDSGRVK